MEFDWIRRADGSSEFLDFVNSLPNRDAAKLFAVIQKTEDREVRSSMCRGCVTAIGRICAMSKIDDLIAKKAMIIQISQKRPDRREIVWKRRFFW